MFRYFCLCFWNMLSAHMTQNNDKNTAMIYLLAGMFHVFMYRLYPNTNTVQWKSSSFLERFSNFIIAWDIGIVAEWSCTNTQENYVPSYKHEERMLLFKLVMISDWKVLINNLNHLPLNIKSWKHIFKQKIFSQPKK